MTANLLTLWARLLVGTLSAAGVRRAVISPGSRSTPLVVALYQHPRIEKAVLIDERSAAFYALGQAKHNGQPTLLVCTSGSALGHYLPALIEANQSQVPLLVLSADRPQELQHNGTPQTIEQAPVLRSQVRAYFDVGAPDVHPDAWLGLRRKVSQAVALALGPFPGPVHLNFGVRKPLEPQTASSELEVQLEVQVSKLLGQPGTVCLNSNPVMSRAGRKRLCVALTRAQRPLLILGPRALQSASECDSLQALAEGGLPIAAEVTSQVRGGLGPAEFKNFDLIYRTRFATEFAPDLAIHLGGAPTSGALAQLLKHAPDLMERIIVSEQSMSPLGWPDPQNNASAVIAGTMADAVPELLKLALSHAEWANRLKRADDAAMAAIADELTESTHAWDEGDAVATLARALPDDELVVIGNSMPLRLFETFSTIRTAPSALTCLSQRGANGIDGLIAQAAGASAEHVGAGTTLLVGDVSFLHDLGSLIAVSQLAPKLRIVVLNNRGGRIFEQLPIASHPNLELQPWTTPHDFDLTRISAAFGINAVAVTSGEQLDSTLCTSERPQIIIAEVAQHGSFSKYQRLVARTERALEPIVSGAL